MSSPDVKDLVEQWLAGLSPRVAEIHYTRDPENGALLFFVSDRLFGVDAPAALVQAVESALPAQPRNASWLVCDVRVGEALQVTELPPVTNERTRVLDQLEVIRKWQREVARVGERPLGTRAAKAVAAALDAEGRIGSVGVYDEPGNGGIRGPALLKGATENDTRNGVAAGAYAHVRFTDVWAGVEKYQVLQLCPSRDAFIQWLAERSEFELAGLQRGRFHYTPTETFHVFEFLRSLRRARGER
ncbi:hypothetical protein HPC49_25375 [Pyxidicoccus fallax]|uniref:Uncharacterized protein n=1 Tax=Pyxidicoccus fallax TaxID=394095 RepID=A0A848LIK2_9BACT|nr:hypothetical protein [Pyxidicoccus fallax]NMO17526.1 hypothetical protein [Pyxidicoccus fallax]NPC81543.1 hypothetical protein [Pyxidicoccus fallax]